MVVLVAVVVHPPVDRELCGRAAKDPAAPPRLGAGVLPSILLPMPLPLPLPRGNELGERVGAVVRESARARAVLLLAVLRLVVLRLAALVHAWPPRG